MKRHLTVKLLFFALLFAGFTTLNAFGSGKIAGKIVDTAGQPLIGVNVIIDGTTQGTVTDVDGNYIIVNVQTGVHTLAISYIGYKTQKIGSVRVITDQTTRINVTMDEAVFEGEEVVITAERPLVQADLTASKKTVLAEEIAALPVESFQGVLATQAGITQGASGELHIRGGRSNEISYMVDGLSVGNPFSTNGLATQVATNAIEELSVVSGAFNAEYGQAMSGIVQITTKDGGTNYEGSFSSYLGETFSGNNTLFQAPSGVSLNKQNYEGSIGGPVPFTGNNIRFFVSGRYDKSNGTYFGTREHLPSDSANFNGDDWYYEFHGVPVGDYLADSTLQVPNEVVAMNPSESFNFSGKLSWRPFAGAKIDYNLLMDGGKSKPFVFAYRFNPDGVATSRSASINHAINWTHTINTSAFYTLKISYAKNNFKSFLYEDPTDPRYASTGSIIGFPGTNFVFGGNQKSHLYEESRSLLGKLDFTYQIGLIHELKVGTDVRIHFLNRENFTVLYDGNRYTTPTVPEIDSPSHDKYDDQRADMLSGYVQDKLEFDNMIINAGVRYDYFNSNAEYFPNPLDPKSEKEGGERIMADAKQTISPRLGISFPITEEGIIHLSYGHFYQMPSLRNLYRNPEFEFGAGTVPLYGNANLKPEFTTLYELGLQQQLTETMAFDVTAYVKDIRNYLVRQNIQFSTIPGQQSYSIYANKDYASVKGLTFALTKRRAQNGLLSANIDYTFQITEGNDNNSGSQFFSFLSGRSDELETIVLDFHQNHVVNASVSISNPSSWGASFIGQFALGYPYSPQFRDQTLDIPSNTGRKPILFKLDAKVFKNVKFGGVNATVFVKAFNLLDFLNERFVFNDTGRATYSLGKQDGVHAAWESRYGQPGIHDLDEYNSRPQYYSGPRSIRVGLNLHF